MKKALFLFAAALLLPLSQAWAGSKYYAKIVANTSSNSSGMGKVYAGSSSTAGGTWTAGSTSYEGNTSTEGGSVSLGANAKANDYYEFVGWSSTNNGSIDMGTTAEYSTSIKTSKTSVDASVTCTLYANFRPATITAFDVTFQAPKGGSYTVDGTTVGSGGLTVTKTQIYKPVLVMTGAEDGNAFIGWYEGDTKVSDATTYTPTYTQAHAIGPKFVTAHISTTLADLKTSVQSNPLTEVPSGTAIVIPKGETVTVASGNSLIVNGTIWVEGAFDGSTGSVSVGGTLAKLTKAFVQKGQNNATGASAQPKNPYGDKKYWVTSVETVSGASVTGPTASSFVRVTNGKGNVYRAKLDASSPAAIICSVDSSVAINHITGITDTSKTKIGDTFSTSLAQMALLMSAQTFSSTSADAGNEHGILDGASSYSFTYSPKNTTAGYKHRIINSSYNCTVSNSAGGYYGNCEFYNCTGITINNFVGKNSAAQMHIYDCTDASYITGFNETSPLSGSINYYSGGPYKTSNFKKNYEGYYHIYGGSWTTKPDDDRIATAVKNTHKFYQHEDTYWYLEPKGDEVMNVDGVEYKDMSAALAAVSSALSAKASVAVSIIKDCTVGSAITVPSGKTLDFELAGCCVTAPNGLFANSGTLYVGDQDGNLSGIMGGRVVTTGGNWLVNNGTADVTYGHYTGNVLLNGGTLVTHHGYFNGNLNAGTGIVAKDAVDLKGGYFTQDVTPMLKAGYYRTSGYVGTYPKPDVSKTYSNDYWEYTFKTLPDYELGLYNNTATSKKSYSLADWQRRAEVMSMVQPWINASYSIDVVAGFDRTVGQGGAAAHVSKPSFVGDQSLDRAVGPLPGDLYRILAPQIANPTSPFLTPGEQKYYTAFLTDSTFKKLVFGFSESDNANKGTTINLRVDFCTGAVGTDISKLRSVYAIMSEYAVMGAGSSNQAMVQPASGAATFYATVADAVAACTKGGTVKLCNDVDGSIAVSGSCKLDMNGMNCAGEIVAGNGYQMTSVTNATVEVEKYLDKDHGIYAFAPIPYAIAYVLGEGGANHPDNPATYTVEDAVTLKAPTRAGHFFTGWAEGDGTIPAGSTGAKTFTATWKKSTVFFLK